MQPRGPSPSQRQLQRCLGVSRAGWLRPELGWTTHPRGPSPSRGSCAGVWGRAGVALAESTLCLPAELSMLVLALLWVGVAVAVVCCCCCCCWWAEICARRRQGEQAGRQAMQTASQPSSQLDRQGRRPDSRRVRAGWPVGEGLQLLQSRGCPPLCISPSLPSSHPLPWSPHPLPDLTHPLLCTPPPLLLSCSGAAGGLHCQPARQGPR